VERVSLITQADYRNVGDLSREVDGLYARLDAIPIRKTPWSILDFLSPDLSLGQSQLIMKPEPYHWDEMKTSRRDQNDQGCSSITEFSDDGGSVYRGDALHEPAEPAKHRVDRGKTDHHIPIIRLRDEGDSFHLTEVLRLGQGDPYSISGVGAVGDDVLPFQSGHAWILHAELFIGGKGLSRAGIRKGCGSAVKWNPSGLRAKQ